AAVEEAVEVCRGRRAPVFLHLDTVRLWGHAGSDVETGYRPLEAIEAAEAADPVVRAARLLIERGAATPAALAEVVRAERARAREAAEVHGDAPKLGSREAVVAPLVPSDEGV